MLFKYIEVLKDYLNLVYDVSITQCLRFEYNLKKLVRGVQLKIQKFEIVFPTLKQLKGTPFCGGYLPVQQIQILKCMPVL